MSQIFSYPYWQGHAYVHGNQPNNPGEPGGGGGLFERQRTRPIPWPGMVASLMIPKGWAGIPQLRAAVPVVNRLATFVPSYTLGGVVMKSKG
jgi:hypothetical protein